MHITALEVTAAIGIAAPVLTLIGVRMTLKHSRKMQLTQLAEEAAHVIRREKRESYVELLKAYRQTVQVVALLGQMSSGQQLRINMPHLQAAVERYNELIAEIEIVATPQISQLAQQLYDATARCLDVMYRTSEDCLSAIGAEPSEEGLKRCLEKTRLAVQREFENLNVNSLYMNLRDHIREELGFLTISPAITPSEVELTKLREELRKLK